MAINVKEIRDLSKEELVSKVNVLKEELYNLRYQSKTARLDKPHKMSQLRHDIARIMTILKESQRNAAAKKT